MDPLYKDEVFASLRVGKAHPDVKTADMGQQCLYLAAHLRVHYPEQVKQGVSPELLAAQIAECFGYGYTDADLKRFKRGMRESGLFQTNGGRGLRCLYSVALTKELQTFLQRYDEYREAEAAKVTPFSLAPAVPTETKKWADAEQANRPDADEPEVPIGMPQSYKDDLAAEALAARFFKSELFGDASMARRVAEALKHLAQQADQSQQ